LEGNDVAFMGAGDDTFVWNPGDGSDLIEGQGGRDTLVFHASNVAEHITLDANGARLRLFRDIANITLDVNGVERVDIDALNGADNLVVNDLAGTSVTRVDVDLASTIGGTLGDGQLDTVVVNGTTGADDIDISANGDTVVVSGLAARVRLSHAESTLDRLIVNGLAGGDTIAIGPGVDALIAVSVSP
jgi:Ca2+-binding RTX toxin-like protein